jgi:S1-C subfamily serine protease
LGAHFIELAAPGPAERGVILRDDSVRNLPAVEKGSPLASLGLKAADKIIAVNNETITDARTLPEIILDYAPGSKVNVTYEKGGRVLTEAVTLGAR